MTDENIPIDELLALLNEGTPQLTQPQTGFKRIAVVVYTKGNVKVVMHKEVGGRHNLPHFHISTPDAASVFGLDGILLEGAANKKAIISQWAANNKSFLTNIWNELQKENPSQDYISSQKNLIGATR